MVVTLEEENFINTHKCFNNVSINYTTSKTRFHANIVLCKTNSFNEYETILSVASETQTNCISIVSHYSTFKQETPFHYTWFGQMISLPRRQIRTFNDYFNIFLRLEGLWILSFVVFMCFLMDINFYHFVTECRNQFSNL